MSNQIRIDYIPLDKVQVWGDRNPRFHDVPAIMDSIQRFGFISPLVLDEKRGKLVAGHGRLEALQVLYDAGRDLPARIQLSPEGDWMVPVVRGASFSTEEEAEAFIVADNRLVETGGWDDSKLLDILKGLGSDPANLVGVGYEAADIEKLLAESSPKAAREARVKPEEIEEAQEEVAPESAEPTTRPAPGRQIVLLYAADEYPEIIRMLDATKAYYQVESNADAVLFLLQDFDASG